MFWAGYLKWLFSLFVTTVKVNCIFLRFLAPFITMMGSCLSLRTPVEWLALQLNQPEAHIARWKEVYKITSLHLWLMHVCQVDVVGPTSTEPNSFLFPKSIFLCFISNRNVPLSSFIEETYVCKMRSLRLSLSDHELKRKQSRYGLGKNILLISSLFSPFPQILTLSLCFFFQILHPPITKA